MDIVIIGSGRVGSALGASLERAGHKVSHPGRGQEASAVEAADAVILAVPWTAFEDVAVRIAGATAGKLVIDAMNPLSRDGGLATASGPSAGEIVARRLPTARVAKAFNTLFASVQGDPDTHGLTVDGLYATDDERAKGEVADLLRSMGFRPVYVGPLARSRELEALAFLNISLQLQAGGDWRTAITLVGAPPKATKEGAKQ